MRALTRWHHVLPVVALAALVGMWGRYGLPALALAAAAALLGGAVLAAVHHAEVIAHRVGEPFGSLLLALAVTVIEVGLILMLMTGGGGQELARDTVFAAVMITTNLIVGLSILAAAGRRTVAPFNAEGSGAALSTVLALTVLTMVLPSVTTSAPGGRFTGAQLGFAAVASLVLWGAFVLTQTSRHRDFFLPVEATGEREVAPDEETHADPPTGREVTASAGLLLAALVSVVGLAKVVSPALESAVSSAGLPASFVGVIIALLVLAPETLAALNNARRGRTQIALNLAYGSAIASIGLTIPAVALAAGLLGLDLVLGLAPLHLVLLGLTAVIGALTVVPGRAIRLQGLLHLVIAAAFVFLAAVP